MSVPVLALLPDPVDGVEVLVGPHPGEGVLQRVHHGSGAPRPVHPPVGTVLLIAPCGEKQCIALCLVQRCETVSGGVRHVRSTTADAALCPNLKSKHTRPACQIDNDTETGHVLHKLNKTFTPAFHL